MGGGRGGKDCIYKDTLLCFFSGWRPKGLLVAHLHEHKSAVNRIRVSDEHSLFATCSNDGTVKIWNSQKMEGKTTTTRWNMPRGVRSFIRLTHYWLFTLCVTGIVLGARDTAKRTGQKHLLCGRWWTINSVSKTYIMLDGKSVMEKNTAGKKGNAIGVQWGRILNRWARERLSFEERPEKGKEENHADGYLGEKPSRQRKQGFHRPRGRKTFSVFEEHWEGLCGWGRVNRRGQIMQGLLGCCKGLWLLLWGWWEPVEGSRQRRGLIWIRLLRIDWRGTGQKLLGLYSNLSKSWRF